MKDVIESSWAYQEMVKKSMIKGEEKGEIRALRRTLIRLIQNHFPSLSSTAEKKIVRIQEKSALNKAIDDMFSAKNAEDAKSAQDAFAKEVASHHYDSNCTGLSRQILVARGCSFT